MTHFSDRQKDNRDMSAVERMDVATIAALRAELKKLKEDLAYATKELKYEKELVNRMLRDEFVKWFKNGEK
jgi:hypothetical protein